MRQIGKLPSRSSAQVLSDYLLTQGISTKVEQGSAAPGEPEQWILWGVNEDQLDRSRALYQEFLSNPEAPHFRSSGVKAKSLRKQILTEKSARERRMFDANRLWSTPRLRDIPVVTSCILISVALSIATGFGETRLGLLDLVYYRPLTVQDLHYDFSQMDLPEGLEEDPTFVQDRKYWKFMEALIFSKKIPRERPKNPDVAILRGQLWRLISPIFLHLNGPHLLFNMLWFYSLGGVLEVRRGSWKLLGMILTIAIISNVAQAHSSSVLFGGMSGVIYGLFVYLWLARVVDPGIGIGVSQQQVVLMMGWMILGFNMPEMNMANIAHLGGALTGAFLALMKKLYLMNRASDRFS